MSGVKVVAINLGVLLLLVIPTEITLRFLFPEKILVSHFNFDQPEFPKHVANSKIVHPVNGAVAQFDSFGMRRDIYECPDEENPRKVLIVGDSNIAAKFVGDESAPGNVLENFLNSNGQGCFDIDSFGVEGFGPDQSLFAANYFVEQVKYDYLVFHLFADNDLGDFIRNNYPLIDGELNNDGYCISSPTIWDRFLVLKASRKLLFYSFGWRPSQKITGSKRDTTCATEFFKSNRSGLSLQSLQRHMSLDQTIFSKGLKSVFINDRYDIEFACKTASSRLLEEAVSRLEAVYRSLLEMGMREKLNVILLIEPSEFDVTVNHQLNAKTFSDHCDLYDRRNLVNIFERSARNVGLDGSVVSLFSDFLGCNDCYFTQQELDGDNHWNAKGIFVAMRLVSEKILNLQSGL